MRMTAKLGAVAAAGALVVAVPASAKPAHPTPPNRPSHASSKSHRCAAHKDAYIASGTLVSWSATRSADGTYSGTITVDVKRANHHAAGQKGSTYTYTLSGTRVRFGKGANPPVAGDRVVLIGKITTVAKKCTDQSAAGKVTLRKVDVSAPKPTK